MSDGPHKVWREMVDVISREVVPLYVFSRRQSSFMTSGELPYVTWSEPGSRGLWR